MSCRCSPATSHFALKTNLATEVDLILPDAFGYPPLGTSLVVNTNYAKTNPNEVTAFLRATLKGAEYMVANKAESVQIVVQYGGTTATRAQHEFQYDVSARDLVAGLAATKGIGYVTPRAVAGAARPALRPEAHHHEAQGRGRAGHVVHRQGPEGREGDLAGVTC
jgi:hypothetical protein